MGTQSDFSVYIDKDIYKGEYSEIKDELKNIFIEIGENFGWKLKSSNSENVVFTTPFSLRSIGETVTVNYSTYRVFITSVSNQKSVMTTWGKNDDNCRKYLNEIIPSVKNYLSKKEISRQTTNLNYLDEIRNDLKQIDVNKDIFKIISDNQSKIDKSLIPNFIKIFQYYEEQVKTHNVIYENINDLNFHTLHTKSIEYSIESIKVYSSTIQLLEFSIKEMFNSYITDDLINFYTIYNKFEEMGLFLTKGEKLIVRGLSDINDNFDTLISGIDNLVDSITDIGNSLSEISSDIKFSNLLSTINTYQLYKLNKK